MNILSIHHHLSSYLVIRVLEYLRATDLANVSEVDKTIFRKDRIQQAIRYQLQNIYSTSCTGTPLKDSSRRSSSFDSPKLLGPVGRSLSFDSPSGGAIKGSHARNVLPSRTVFDSPSAIGITGGGGGGGGGGIHAYHTPTATLDDSEYQPHILYIREIKCILAAIQTPQSITGKGYWIRCVLINSSSQPILSYTYSPSLYILSFHLTHHSLFIDLSLLFSLVPRGLLMLKSILKHFLCLKW